MMCERFPGLLRVLVVLLVGMILSCGGVARQDGPRPGSGAATVEELVAFYREAHANKGPERLGKIDFTRSLLADWVPMNAEQKATLLGLFELDLEDVRVVEMPFIDPGELVLSYATQKPNVELSELTWSVPELNGRLTLDGQ